MYVLQQKVDAVEFANYELRYRVDPKSLSEHDSWIATCSRCCVEALGQVWEPYRLLPNNWRALRWEDNDRFAAACPACVTDDPKLREAADRYVEWRRKEVGTSTPSGSD